MNNDANFRVGNRWAKLIHVILLTPPDSRPNKTTSAKFEMCDWRMIPILSGSVSFWMSRGSYKR